MKDDPYRTNREAIAAWNREQSGYRRRAPSLGELTVLGQQLWPHTYGTIPADHPDRDMQAFSALIAHLRAINPRFAESVELLPSTQILSLWACRWADQGFPVIQIGHRYAASMMATGLSRLDADHVLAPFKAFCVNLPTGMLTTEFEGKTLYLSHLYVHQLVDSRGAIVWNIQVISPEDISLWKHGVPTEGLCDEELPEEATDWSDYSFSIPTADSDERTMGMIGRLLLGICLTMASPDSTRPVGKGHRYEPAQLRESAEPLQRVYQVGLPIKLDVRDAVQAYLRGETSKSPSVQTLVRGHWRRVACGKGSAQRRWSPIEPYWRGPDDAPVLVRPVRVEA